MLSENDDEARALIPFIPSGRARTAELLEGSPAVRLPESCVCRQLQRDEMMNFTTFLGSWRDTICGNSRGDPRAPQGSPLGRGTKMLTSGLCLDADAVVTLCLDEDECGLVRVVLLKAKRIRSSQLEVTDYRRQVPKLPSRRPCNHLAPRG